MKEKVLLPLVVYVHYAVLVYSLFGWLIPGPVALTVYLSAQVLMVIQWKFNHGTCILTNIENWLKGVPWSQRGEQQGDFIGGIIRKVLKIDPTDRQIEWFVYGVMIILSSLDILTFMLYEAEL